MIYLASLSLYLEDIITNSKSIKEHLKHLNIVLDSLKEYCFYIKLNGYEFLLSFITYLGYEKDISDISQQIKSNQY